MSKYYGIFQEIKDLYKKEIIEYGIYENVFSEIYSDLQSVSGELDYYLENAYCVGKDVLEICCGDGLNYMIPMAKKGFHVDGVEISESMIQQFETKCAKLPTKVKNNLHIYKSDIYEFQPEHKYDLIIIPSTTICLLSDNDEAIKKLFIKIYEWLNPGGRFMFDYRVDQIIGNLNNSEIMSLCNQKEKYFMIMQEFVNYVPGRSVVNMYVQKSDNEGEHKFIASSDKRIISDELINYLTDVTKFVVMNKYMLHSHNIDICLMVLEKQGE